MLARFEVVPGWDESRAAAIRRQRWTPVTRILLRVQRRFWGNEHSTLLAASDQPTVRWIVGIPPVGDEDVLTAYVMGSTARVLGRLSPEARAEWVRTEAAQVFPEWDEADRAEVLSHSWEEDRFAGGGYPWPAVGDDTLPALLSEPLGRLHFAGEHTTHHFAWIQGAMESGLRAAHEVDSAP
jgi:monoamine oxidase